MHKFMFYCFRVKFWNVRYLEEMKYDKTKKPGILPKNAVKSKAKKQQAMREDEHQLPSSSRGNRRPGQSSKFYP